MRSEEEELVDRLIEAGYAQLEDGVVVMKTASSLVVETSEDGKIISVREVEDWEIQTLSNDE